MKKIFFSLIAAAIAVGGSAFTNGTAKPALSGTYYVLTAAGTYVRTTSEPTSAENCESAVGNQCWLQFAEDQGPAFKASAIPSAPIIAQSNFQGIYNPQ